VCKNLSFEEIADITLKCNTGTEEERKSVYDAYLDTIDASALIEEQRSIEEDWDYEQDWEYHRWIEYQHGEDFVVQSEEEWGDYCE